MAALSLRDRSLHLIQAGPNQKPITLSSEMEVNAGSPFKPPSNSSSPIHVSVYHSNRAPRIRYDAVLDE
ncbi:unnamed protein product [Fusarium graminearum]|nr:unnamed protein product [Fusarium graminearum]